MGGFYPMPAAPDRRALFEPVAPRRARAGRDARHAAARRRALALVVDGEPIVAPGRPAPSPSRATTSPYPTIVTDRVLRPATITVGGHVVRYLHRRPRPPASEDQPLPYVREDIAGAGARDGAPRARSSPTCALGRLAAAASRPIRRDLPLTLVEAPLRHELVQAHGDVILVSDQIFRIFPVDRLRKYHRLEIARAVLAAVVDARLARDARRRSIAIGGRRRSPPT